MELRGGCMHYPKDKQINVSSRGIIFIPTTFIDYNLGIEWRSVNAFMFNKGKVVKNIIKMSSDLSGILEYRNDIISLDYIADAQYFEIHDLLSEREESFLKEKNFFAEKSFLTMRNVLNELLR